MIRPLGAFLLMLPAAAAFVAAPVRAQSSRIVSQYRGASPSDLSEDRLPPSGSWIYGDDDQSPRRPYRVAQQRRRGGAGPLPYPDDQADAAPLPPPAFAPNGGSPDYGHQLDAQPPVASGDRDAMRPPGAIGAAPSAAPQGAPAAAALPPEDQPEQGQPKALPPNLQRQLVDFQTKEPAGTIIVDTPNTYLYLVLGHGKALRYGIGVGREGFTWTGTERVSRMKEWPDWFPPPEMIERQPYLPRMMAGGPGNPLGARALYLGHTLYRIHGTNQPSTIGSFVSSGCIRLLNSDIEDLYSRVQVGTRVVVLPGKPPESVANSNSVPGASATKSSVMVEPASSGPEVSSSPLPPPR